jgi:hypothetical protein
VVSRDSNASRLACFLVLAEGAARLVQHALDQAHELVFLEGLLDEVHRALLHRGDGHRHVAVAGDEHDGQRALALEQAVLQFEAAHAVHADVGDQAGHLARVEARQERLGRVEALDAVVLAFQQPLQGVTHGLVVIDDVDGAFFGNQAHGGVLAAAVGRDGRPGGDDALCIGGGLSRLPAAVHRQREGEPAPVTVPL